jgi:hypothetical protein
MRAIWSSFPSRMPAWLSLEELADLRAPWENPYWVLILAGRILRSYTVPSLGELRELRAWVCALSVEELEIGLECGISDASSLSGLLEGGARGAGVCLLRDDLESLRFVLGLASDACGLDFVGGLDAALGLVDLRIRCALFQLLSECEKFG